MAAKDNRRSILNQVVDGRQSFRDPAIIRNRSIFERYVEVATDKYALALYV